MDQLRIAIAAETPLYLPLFLAKRCGFFNHLRGTPIIMPPEAGRKASDCDWWAAQRVNEKDATFALCDPLEALRFNNVAVIGLLVEVAAFWLVARENAIGSLRDLGTFDHVFTYPSGMTGNRIARFLVRGCIEKPKVQGVAVDSELEALKKNRNSVALTANIVRALELQETSAERFTVSEAWLLHPSLSSLALTGIVTHKDHAQSDEAYGFLQSMQKAGALASTDRQEALWTLSRLYAKHRPPEDLLIQAVKKLQDARLWSFLLYPGWSSFSNAWHVSGRFSAWRQRADRMQARGEWLLPKSAETLRSKTEKQIAPSRDELWRPVREDLLRKRGSISVRKHRVVGNYVRGNEKACSDLKDFVRKLRDSLRTDYREKRAFLIWGPPGEGKTSLVEQLIKEHNNNRRPGVSYVNLVEIRMDDNDPQKAFREKIQEAKSIPGTGPIVIVIDEVDAGQPKHWLPHKLLHLIDKGITGRTTLVVMIGSCRGGIDQLKGKLRTYSKDDFKIDDVFSRVGGKEVSIPSLDVADMLAIVAARALNKGKEKIKATALYYFLVRSFGSSSRGLVEDVDRWFSAVRSKRVGNLQSRDPALKGDRKEFWNIHQGNHKALVNTWLTIKP